LKDFDLPIVSVIIPTYNRCEQVAETINSVLDQTERDLEIIVVDDGSTDDTRVVIESIQDPRIKYYYKENGGAASARNLGLSNASGKYVAFLDSDDLWPKNYLEIMVGHLEKNSTFAAVYCPITVIYPDGSKVKSYNHPKGLEGWICEDLFANSFIWIFAAVFRSSAWKGFYFDENLGNSSEDSDAILRLSMKVQFMFVPNVEVFHRISSDSISAGVGVNLNRVLSQERFYLQLGGNKIMPTRRAKKRLSHSLRKVAEDRRKKSLRKAALELYKRAILYWPRDIRLYLGLARTFFLNKNNDTEPNWTMPEPLSNPIGPNRRLQENSKCQK
jgi:glycosyltransferase involved in cell wall biosynthesis